MVRILLQSTTPFIKYMQLLQNITSGFDSCWTLPNPSLRSNIYNLWIYIKCFPEKASSKLFIQLLKLLTSDISQSSSSCDDFVFTMCQKYSLIFIWSKFHLQFSIFRISSYRATASSIIFSFMILQMKILFFKNLP